MKTIIKLPALFLLMATFFFACKKDETKVLFEGGTAPVLSVSDSSSMVLTRPDSSKIAVVFSWTNPDYSFNTGVSSQDVNYMLQVDTAGANFTSPLMQEIAIPKDLSKTFTVRDLNAVLSKLNLQEDIPHQVQFKLRASLSNNSVPLYSNIIEIEITPYLDVVVPIPPTGEMYITGNAMPSDWTNAPPESQKCEKDKQY